MLLPGVSTLASGISYPVVRGSQPAATGYFIDGVRVPRFLYGTAWKEDATQRLVEDLRGLPKPVQKTMIGKFQLMLETASEVHHVGNKRPAYVRENPEWHMLTSRN